MPRILVTNDDGYRSEGIRALADALRAIGDVTIVAPMTEASAIGHALTTELGLRREAVGPFADRLPCRDVGHGDRAFCQASVRDHVLDVDMLRPVDQRHDANVVDRETPQLHSDPSQDSLVSTFWDGWSLTSAVVGRDLDLVRSLSRVRAL